MARRSLRAFLWLLIFPVEFTLCLALFIGATAFLSARRLDRDARQVRVTAPLLTGSLWCERRRPEYHQPDGSGIP